MSQMRCINGKMSELQAAMGLVVLKYIDEIIKKRKDNHQKYSNELKGLKMIRLREGTQWNFSYTLIVFESEEELWLLKKKLSQSDITTRRYFYPSLNKLKYVNSHGQFGNSENLAFKILTLPNYYTLRNTEMDFIVSQINQVL